MMGLEETSPGSGAFTLTQTVPLVGGIPLSRRISTFGENDGGEIFVGTKQSSGVMALTNGLPGGEIYQVVPDNYQTPPYQTWRTTFFPDFKTGQYLDPEGDSYGDGIGNQIEYAYGFSPHAANSVAQTGFSASRNSSDFTLTFRRDPAATDLVYNLQTSPDLVTYDHRHQPGRSHRHRSQRRQRAFRRRLPRATGLPPRHRAGQLRPARRNTLRPAADGPLVSARAVK